MFVDANDKSTMLDPTGKLIRWSVIDMVTGNEVPQVVCCDDAAGVLTRFVTDQNGKVLLNGRRDRVMTVTETGSFRLVAHAS